MPDFVVGLIAAAMLLAFLYPFLSWVPFHRAAKRRGVDITFSEFNGLKMRNVDVALVVDELVRANSNKIEFPLADMKMHYMAGGNLSRVVDGMIAAKAAGVELTSRQAMAIDLAGYSVNDYIRHELNAVRAR